MKIFQSLSILMLLAVFSQACNSSDIPGYKKTDSGLYYKLHEKNKGQKPSIGDIMTFDLIYSDEDGNVLMDTRPGGHPAVMELGTSEYDGDIYEGLAMLSVSDSASFILDADDFFMITAQVPEEAYDFIRKGSKLYVDVKMLNIQTQEEFEQEYVKQMEEQAEAADLAYQEEQRRLMEYLQENNITKEPLMSGLIYIEIEDGTGAQAKAGSEVAVHYTGMLLDGTVFDSSLAEDRGEPISFVLGQRQVIQGWDEGIMLMKVGGKARLIIPSFLAYGDRGAGNVIPPFSTLIFDVELVQVK